MAVAFFSKWRARAGMRTCNSCIAHARLHPASRPTTPVGSRAAAVAVTLADANPVSLLSALQPRFRVHPPSRATAREAFAAKSLRACGRSGDVSPWFIAGHVSRWLFANAWKHSLGECTFFRVVGTMNKAVNSAFERRLSAGRAWCHHRENNICLSFDLSVRACCFLLLSVTFLLYRSLFLAARLTLSLASPHPRCIYSFSWFSRSLSLSR